MPSSLLFLALARRRAAGRAVFPPRSGAFGASLVRAGATAALRLARAGSRAAGPGNPLWSRGPGRVPTAEVNGVAQEQQAGSAGPAAPNIARIYGYFLGGQHHYPADRDVAEALVAAAPDARAFVVENRRFLVRAVRYLAGQGIRQFLDIGAGLPTQEVERFLAGLDLVEPGLVPLPGWHPEGETAEPGAAGYGAVGRVPGR